MRSLAVVLALLLLPGVVAQNGTTDGNSTTNATAGLAMDPPILHRWENPLPQPLDGPWGAFGLNLVLWGLISAVAILLVGPLLTRIAKALPGNIDDHIVQIIRAPGFTLLFVYGAVDSARPLDLPGPARAALETVWDVFWIIGITWMGYRLWKEVLLDIGKRLSQETESDLDDKLYPFFAKVGGVVIVVAGFFFLLDSVGVDITVFAAGGAVVSLVIAFAAQDTIGNFFAGVFILLDRPFREGDRIEIKEENTWGDVVEIGLRTTRIRTRDNRMVIVPNSVIGGNPVINHSYPSAEYRLGVDVGIAYGTDIDHATDVLMDAVRSVDGVNQDKRIEVLFREFGDSALQFHVRAWFLHYLDARRYEDKLNRAIDRALRDAAIEVPFPQRVVHLPQEG